MTRGTQGLVLGVLGALLLRLAITGDHLFFVNAWMRWPLVGSGVLLIALALHQARTPGHHHAPRAAWLLVLPVLVVFLVAPAPLGSYVADRRVNQLPPQPAGYFPALPAADVLPMKVIDFVVRAEFDTGRTLEDRTVELTGFVSTQGDRWFVTRIAINCCAADAAAYRVQVEGPPAPPRDSWVTVTGTWLPAGGTGSTPALHGADVVPVARPRSVYE